MFCIEIRNKMTKRFINENYHHISQQNYHYVFLCIGVIYWCAANWNKWNRISLSPFISIFLYYIAFLSIHIFLYQFIRSYGYEYRLFRIFIASTLICWNDCSIKAIMDTFVSKYISKLVFYLDLQLSSFVL